MGSPREQGDIPVGYLGADGDKMFVGSAHRAIGYFYFSGVTVDKEYLNIAGRIYQFTDDGIITVTGAVEVDISAGTSAAIGSAALVAAVNGDSHSNATAKLMTGDTVALIGDDETNMALTENTTNVDLSAAVMTNGAVDTQKALVEDRYTMTTQDLAVMAVPGDVVIGTGVFVGTPHLRGLVIMDTDGELKPVTANDIKVYFEQVSGHLYQLVAQDDNTVFVAGDTLDWIAVG